jgi:2-oxo-3-hexenedioate decarboxylase/2-keto-4-pentenoate hydratase
VNPGIDEAAGRIVEARRTLNVLDDLSGAAQVPTLDDGYRIQRAAIERWDDEIAGWKVGATARQVQKLFGVSEPAYGPVFRKTVFQSPARVPARSFHHLMLESEFAFRLGADLPGRPAPYAREEILAAVDSLIPAFEIVSPRFNRLTVDKFPQVVADFCANGGAILGTPVENWRGIDLPAHAVKLFMGGAFRQEGKGAAVLDDPVNVLEWFVNKISAQGLTLSKGQFVLTGTMTGIHTAEVGQRAVADFGNLATVEVTFV